MIKILLLAVVPFMTQHRNVVPKTEVSTNFYGSVTGVVTAAYIQERSSVELPQKWALANVTNEHGNAVNASDVGAVPFVEDVNSNKTAVTIGSRKSDEPVGWYSLANGSGTTASGYYSHAEGDYTTASGDCSHAEGSGTTASGYSSHAEGYLSQTKADDIYAFAWNGDESKTEEDPYKSHGPGTFNINPLGGLAGFYIGEQTLSAILLRSVTNNISATNPDFSDAVLAVNVDFATNTTGAAYVAVTNALAGFGFDADALAELPGGKVYGSIGALLAALAAAAAWLKKNKVQTLKLENGSVETSADGGVAKLDDFFTNSNSLLTGTIDAEVISKGTAPDAHLEASTDEQRLKLVLADNSVAYDSAKALPYKLTSVIGDRVVATMTLTAASTDITLPTIAANDTTVKDFILDVTNAYAVEGVATDAAINIPRTDFKLVTRDGESLTDVTTVKAGKSAFICFTQKSPVVVDGTTYPCWCVIQLPFGDPS